MTPEEEDAGYAALARDPEAVEHWQTRRGLAGQIREGLAAVERGETEDLGSFAQYAEWDTPETEIDAMMASGEPVELAAVRPLTITYDPQAEAAYVYLVPRDDAHSARTQELSHSVMVDYDADGNVIGMELLGVAGPVIEGRPPCPPASPTA